MYDDLSNAAMRGEATLELVHAALAAGTAYAAQQGFPAPDPSAYWQDEWLAELNAAGLWWPRDTPPRYTLPNFSYWFKIYWHKPTTRGMNFRDTLIDAGQRVSTWLAEEGHSVENPNETPEERSLRRNRERVNKHRKGKRAARQEDEVVAFFRAELDEHRAVTKTHLAVLDEHVRDCHARMLAAADERRKFKEDSKQQEAFLRGQLDTAIEDALRPEPAIPSLPGEASQSSDASSPGEA